MQPQNHILDTYRRLSLEVVGRAEPYFEWGFITDADGNPAQVNVQTRSLWRPVPEQLASINTTITNLGENIFAIAISNQYTDAAKENLIAEQANQAKALIATASSDILSRCNAIVSICRDAAYPKRPQPQDAAQEAALAGIKSDLRMVWDTIKEDALLEGMAASLSRALGDDDGLTTWLIASSRWPEDYLQSRGEDERVKVWPSYVASILDEMTPELLAGARQMYNNLADARYGLPVFEVLLNQLGEVINDAMGWRPSAIHPLPPTRDWSVSGAYRPGPTNSLTA